MHESECSFGAKAHASLPANTTAQCLDLEFSDDIIFTVHCKYLQSQTTVGNGGTWVKLHFDSQNVYSSGVQDSLQSQHKA